MQGTEEVSGEGTGGRGRGPAGGIRQERAKAAEMAGDVDLRRERETMREQRDGEGATKREEGREGGLADEGAARAWALGQGTVAWSRAS